MLRKNHPTHKDQVQRLIPIREAAVVAEGSRNRGCSAMATCIYDQSVVGKKRKGRGGGSKKTENQQTLLV
jgi:hypothetical protein